MQVGDTTIITPVIVPLETPAVRPLVRETRDGRSTERDKREAPTEQRRADFRAALSAATGDTSILSQPITSETRVDAHQQTLFEKLPSQDTELDGAEAADLYRASRDATPSDTATDDTSSTDDARVPTHQYLAATQRYAQRYFSVGGTLAGRGESLEIRA